MVDQGRRLGQLLARVLAAALRVVELLRVVRQEGLDRLLRIAVDHVETGRQRGELLLLRRELGLLVLQGLGRVDHRRLGARLRLDQPGAHVDPLLQRRHQVLLGLDRPQEHVPFGGLLRPLGVERGERRRELPEVGREHPVLALAQRRGDVVRPVDRSQRSEGAGFGRRERGLSSQRLGADGGERLFRGDEIRLRRRAVELDQNVALRHRAAVGRPDGGDPPGVERLDHLDPAGRLKFALGRGDDVDAADIGPGDSDHHQRADDPQEGQMHRRGWRLEDFQRRREKLPVGQPAPERLRQRQRARGATGRGRQDFGRSGGWRAGPGLSGPGLGEGFGHGRCSGHDASPTGALCSPQR